MTRSFFFLACPSALAGLLVIASTPAMAQSQSLFGNRSLSNQSGGSSSMFGNSGSAGSGQRGGGGSVTGPGFLQTSQIGALGSFFDEGFVGRRNAADGFVGRRSQTGTFNRNQNFRSLNFDRESRNSDRSRDDSRVNETSSGTRLSRVRPRHVVGFNYPRPTAAVVDQALQVRLSQAAASRPQLSGLAVTYDAELAQATISGSVDSVEASKVAEALIRLEPGVRTVRNNLTIVADSGPPAAPAPNP